MEQEKINKAITKKVLAELRKRHWTPYKLYMTAGLKKSTLYSILDGSSNWSTEYIEKVGEVLNLSYDQLVYDTDNYIIDSLVKENTKLKEDVLILQDKIETYESIAKVVYDSKKKLKKSKHKKIKERVQSWNTLSLLS